MGNETRIRVNLIEQLVKHDKSISEIEGETGVARGTLYRFLRNQSGGISFKTLEALCECFGCTVSDLIVMEE